MAFTRTRNVPRSSRLQKLQARCVERLGHRLRLMLDHIDDVFFDLADGAISDDHQNEYFQAMREVRMRRDNIESHFRAALANAFLDDESPREDEGVRADLPADIIVAVDAMASRMRSQHPAALLQIETRLRLLMPGITAAEELPLAPESICNTFMSSLQSVDISPNAQLILLKHFEREVLPEFAPLLRDALDILRAARFIEKEKAVTISSATPTLSPATPANFMHRLEQLQKQVLEQDPNASPEMQSYWQHQIRQSAQTPRQENTINAVFMLFEYMLERQELSPPQATAFARLQIPVIRVALQDNHFIRDAGHPARRLLKTLANVTLRHKRSHHDEDTLTRALDETVRVILQHDNVLDEALCRQLENDFLAVLNGQSLPAKPSTNDRLWDTSPSDASQTRALVDHLLQNRLQGKTVPEDFVGFMGGPWTTWLRYCRELNGNASAAWLDALKLTDELIWSVQPHADEAGHQQWMKRLPSLVKSVTDVLGQKLTSQERDSAIESLWRMHAALLKSDPALRFVTLDFTPTEPGTPNP